MVDDVQKIVEQEIERGDSDVVAPDAEAEQNTPTYRKVGDSKIPTSKNHGMLWKSRRDQSLRKRKNNGWQQAWDEAIRYYRNDQTDHRMESEDADYAGNEHAAMTMHRSFSETENIVFANTSALVPILYAKNPSVEFTAVDQEDNALGTVLDKLISRLMSKKAMPGINLKPKARKSVVMATLTNAAYMEVGYTFREQSSEQAVADLERLSDELEKAKSAQEIERIEGELQALEETVDLLRPAGPWCKPRRPHDVLRDPDSDSEDLSDDKWIMIADYVPTTWLNAVYGKRNKDSETVMSVFEPTHVLAAQGNDSDTGHNSAEVEINQYTLLTDDDEKETWKQQGYDDEVSYNKAKRTKVWYVWDRVTRRVFLFSDRDWKWPIWVWDDPYRLQGFFPLFKLQFYTDPEGPDMRGEVSYYLDQQDAINTINSELKQARQWARRNVFYDKNRASKDEVEAMLKGDNDTAIGIDVPEGQTLKDFIMPMLPPSMQVRELFDKQPILEAIDRVSSVQPVMRGVEFKTNTTNEAINKYNSIAQTRTDEKIDAVEDFIGHIGWAMAQLCLQFMSREQVAALLGDKMSFSWQNMSAEQIDAQIQMIVVGGSTQKPTSESKKKQALEMGQVLGQFVQAAPQQVMAVLMRQLASAFNDTIPDEDWQMLLDALQPQQPPVAQQGGAPSEGGPEPAGGEAPSGGAASAEQILAQLPPEAQQAFAMAVEQGAPPDQALQRIVQELQSA